ncbi:MAG TPA: hypothetical protein VGZ27_04140 [Vicinamibacterales bacterium]|jgi:hypothetical protein|nr:hypothetical protein [Vicinamibacterales bacterium]
MRHLAHAAIAILALGSMASAQVPQPFPRPQNPQNPARPAPAAPQPAPAPAPTQNAPAPPPAGAAPAGDTPTEASLGFPIYPNAQFVTSYDAGHGQRYYLFGSDAGFPALVKYYQTVFKTKGTLVFETPATQVFEMGRFDERTMAFPPGVTIKDYTWNGSAGYLNPKRGGKPDRFPSIIQIVPAGPGAPR